VSNVSAPLLATHSQVIRALLRYTDWWPVGGGSVIPVGGARRSNDRSDGIPPSILNSLDERTELCRRMERLSARDRRLVFLWYVKQLSAEEIAKDLRISRRQCFRIRAKTIDEIVQLADDDRAA
jgi:DNA-directed RNA polymerase specialized sigma24 family protein